MTTDLSDALNRLAAMPPAELRAQWRRVYRSPAPTLSPDLLRRGIAWRLQERHHGGLAPAAERALVRLAEQDDAQPSPAMPASTYPRPGTRLVRSWNGTTYTVLVTDEGYQMGDRFYRSLSSIAHAITGTRWSGPRFFGLKAARADRHA